MIQRTKEEDRKTDLGKPKDFERREEHHNWNEFSSSR